ncbi:hypothetical protein N2152v2_001198 [Parachlorella kessleri]
MATSCTTEPEGREWWVQLQQQRHESGGLRRKSNRGLPPPQPRTLQALLDALQDVQMSPELASDLGLQQQAGAEPLASREGSTDPTAAGSLAHMSVSSAQLGDGHEKLPVEDAGGGGASAQPELEPSLLNQQPRRRSKLLAATEVLVDKMGQHKHGMQDEMARLATADAALAAAHSVEGIAATAAAKGIDRTVSDMNHLAEMLQSGSDLLSRCSCASSTWESLHRCKGQPGHAGSSSAAALPTIAEDRRTSATGTLQQQHQQQQQQELGAGRLLRDPGSPRRPHRKSLLGQPALGSSAGGSRLADVALPQASAAIAAAQRRREDEQEAELAEAIRMGALGDPEIQEYLIRELKRSRGPRRRAKKDAAQAGVAFPAEGGTEEDNDDRLDPIVQAWLVTKVPAPRVEGYAPPPTRTACRLIAAQEMHRYHQEQKKRTGSFFKFLRLTEEQVGNRDPGGKFVVGIEGKAADGRQKSFKGIVRKQAAVGTINQMIKSAAATHWAREHVDEIAAAAAKQMARQHAIAAWQWAFARLRTLPREVIAAWGPLEAEASGSCDAVSDAQQGRQQQHAWQQEQHLHDAPGAWYVGSEIDDAIHDQGPGGPNAASGAEGHVSHRPSNAGRSRAGSFQPGTRPGTGKVSLAGSLGPYSRLQSIAGEGRQSTWYMGGPNRAAERPRQASAAQQRQGVSSTGVCAGSGLSPEMSDLAAVAMLAVAEQKRRGGGGHLSKLPPLNLEKLEKHWQQAAMWQQNSERARQERKAKEHLLVRWESLRQRRAGAGQAK